MVPSPKAVNEFYLITFYCQMHHLLQSHAILSHGTALDYTSITGTRFNPRQLNQSKETGLVAYCAE